MCDLSNALDQFLYTNPTLTHHRWLICDLPDSPNAEFQGSTREAIKFARAMAKLVNETLDFLGPIDFRVCPNGQVEKL